MRFPGTPSNAILLTLLSSAIAAGCGAEDAEPAPANDAAGDSAHMGIDVSPAGGSSNAGADGSGGSSPAGSSGAAGATVDATSTAGAGGNAAGAGGKLADASARDAAGATGGFPSPRRPFLVGGSLRSARRAARTDWSATVDVRALDLDDPTRHALLEAWLQDALEEHASVAAFARLSLLLLSLGAPADLVHDAQRASLDEIAHAKLCFGLASRYANESCGPSALPLEQAFDAVGPEELARLIAAEGCIGETLGAVLAREQLSVARDPHVARALARVCREEMRHAAFSWRLAAWLIGSGGAKIRSIVMDASEQALAAALAMPERALTGVDLAAWHAHGRLSCAEAKAVTARAAAEVVRPSLRELASRVTLDA